MNDLNLRIITHSGRAHLDELVACSMLILRKAIDAGVRVKDINQEDVTILRVYQAELSEKYRPGDYVVDIGEKYDGEHWFDHHQGSVGKLCSAHLVAERFFPELMEDRHWSEVMDTMSVIDCQGIYSFDYKYDKAHSIMAHAWLFTNLFSSDPVYAALAYARGLELKLDYIKQGREAATNWTKKNMKLLKLKPGLNAGLLLTDPRDSGIETQAAHGEIRKMCRDWNIRILCAWSLHHPPGDARILIRVFPNDCIDFRKCSPSEPVFVNPNGSSLVFRSDDWKALAEEAYVKSKKK